MSGCCITHRVAEEANAARATCPNCGTRGRHVEPITLKALLLPEALARLEPVTYCFCPSPACRIVYFATEGESVYDKGDLKVRVGLKERDEPIPLCYCFGHTRATVWEEIRRTGRSTAVASITAHVKAGRCGCEVNNPSGACCLGEVSKAVKEGFARYGERDPASPATASLDKQMGNGGSR